MTYNELLKWVMSLPNGEFRVRQDKAIRGVTFSIRFDFNDQKFGIDEAITRSDILYAREGVDSLLGRRFDCLKAKTQAAMESSINASLIMAEDQTPPSI